MPKEVLILAVVGSLVLEDYVPVTCLPSRLSWGREPGIGLMLNTMVEMVDNGDGGDVGK